MTKVNRRNGSQTNPDIIPCDIFKSDAISFFTKKYLSISMTQNQNFSVLYWSQNTKIFQ